MARMLLDVQETIGFGRCLATSAVIRQWPDRWFTPITLMVAASNYLLVTKTEVGDAQRASSSSTSWFSDKLSQTECFQFHLHR